MCVIIQALLKWFVLKGGSPNNEIGGHVRPLSPRHVRQLCQMLLRILDREKDDLDMGGDDCRARLSCCPFPLSWTKCSPKGVDDAPILRFED